MGTIKRKVNPSVKSERSSELKRILMNDKKLQEDEVKLALFIDLATLYEEDFVNNMYLTSAELDEKYFTNDMYSWNDFKMYPPVRQYTNRFVMEMQHTEAQRHVSREGIQRQSDAIKVQTMIEDKMEESKNRDVYVFLIPQRNYRKYED